MHTTQQLLSLWEETKEFGRKIKVQALGRIVSHTTYHAGQLAIVLKYGK